MFGHLNKLKGAIFVLLLTVIFSGGWLLAFEGIQGQHAIFYPSLELIYEHDDNWFRDARQEESANIFVARPTFRLEIPGARQFFMIEYMPQFRDVDLDQRVQTWDLRDNFTHYINADAKLVGSSVFSVDIKERFAHGILETKEIDLNEELYYANDDFFSKNQFDIDFRFDGTTQGRGHAAGVGVRQEQRQHSGSAPAAKAAISDRSSDQSDCVTGRSQRQVPNPPARHLWPVPVSRCPQGSRQPGHGVRQRVPTPARLRGRRRAGVYPRPCSTLA